MLKVLIADDDKNICDILRLYLEHEGFEIFFAHDGSRALTAFQEQRPDIMLLDIMLPLINGWEVCKMIRRSSEVPIIMLTARDAMEDKLEGLNIGADDYVVKPFDPKEVVARVKVQMRRQTKESTPKQQGTIVVGSLAVNLDRYEVLLDEKPVDLKPKETQLLHFLIKNRNIVFSREKLLSEVWGYDYMGETRTVDVHVKRLREKLNNGSEQWDIKTVWGVGYKFEVK